MTLDIAANETGLIRVFALSMSDEQAQALKVNSTDGQAETDASALQDLALGGTKLNDAHIEVFPVADLGDLALPDYLIDGAGAKPEAIDTDRFKLSSLEGWVMLVYSSAFRGQKQTLTPAAQLTLVGTYPQVGIDWSPQIDLSTPSALPQNDGTPKADLKKHPSNAAMSGRVAMVALLVMFLLVGLMVWIAG